MVAQTDTDRAAKTAPIPIRSRSNVQRLIRTISRLVGIQTKLLLLRTKLTARKVLLFVGLMAGAVGAALVGAIFLLIGLFKALTVALMYVVGRDWASALAFVIFAVVLLGVALILVLMARRVFPTSKPGKAVAPRRHPNNLPRYAYDIGRRN